MRGASAGRDEGGIVLGWLLRVSAVLLVLGVIGFDVMSLAYTNVTTVDDAGIVAGSGAMLLMEQPGAYEAARDESLQVADQLGVRLRARDWWIDEEGEVHVTVSRRAHSLALQHVPQLERYLTVRAVGTAMAG
ncbi:MAG: hypothetical protein MUD13_02195 [Candidatus Nanopelagicales bacterium]|jgi:hypothetical protein|nr:hypothetical protein [Candidatus Nanopelagicales bacterium]